VNTPGQIHPLVAALMDQLPPVGSHWPEVQRQRFITALEAVIRLLYTAEDPVGNARTATESGPATSHLSDLGVQRNSSTPVVH
jgi:hypothetical protein